jgi:hypothetical protein
MTRNSPAAPLTALILAAGSLASVAHAQSWSAPVDGNWFDAAKWTPGVVPTGAAATGVLGLAGAYTVSTTTNTLLGVNITDPAAVLAINAGNSLTLGSASNTLNGQIVINGSAAYAGTNMNVGSSTVSFSGTGAIRLNASTSDGSTTVNTAAIFAGAGGSLTMGAGTKIGGFGIINNAPTTNNGTFTADIAGQLFRVEGQTHQNNALYTAANTGSMLISSAVINQSGSGSIAPGANSSVALSSSSVNGGSLTSSATGRVQVTGGTVGLSGVTINGGLDIYPSTATIVGPAGWNLSGGATVLLNVPAAYAGTNIRTATPNTPINGNGTIRLNASTSDGSTTSNTAALAEGGGSPAGSYVFAPGVTVAGFGIITNVATTNNGTINADISTRLLRIEAQSHQNNSLYTATGGGSLLLSNATITQAPGAAISAVGSSVDGPSSVQIAATSITGGSLISNGAAHVGIVPGNFATLESVTISGQFDQGHSTSLFIDAPGLTLAPGSTLLVNSAAAYAGTHVRTGDAVTIGGSGTVRLNASTSDGAATASTSALSEDGGPAGGVFTFAPNVTLAGFGIVNNVPTVNNGTFNADIAGRPLRLEGSAHQNNALYQSSGGGSLWLANTTVNQTGSARVYAGNGSDVHLSASTINGGIIGSLPGGTGVAYLDSSTSNLNGVSISRQLQQEQSGTLATTGFTLTNNALVTINSNASYAGTRIRSEAAPAVIGGAGTLHLNASTSDGSGTAGTADIQRDSNVAGSGFTFGAGVTVDGFGRIADCPTTNNGVIDANAAGHPLRIESNTHQNNGVIRSSNGGYLDLAGCTIVQAPAGQVRSGNGSGVNLNGCDLSGGSLEASGSGVFTVVAGSTLHGLTSNAPINVNPSTELDVAAPGITNNGVITVNSSASYAGTRMKAVGGAVTLGGGGTVLLNYSTSDGNTTAGTADLVAAAGSSFVFGAGQTLAGIGRINCPVTMSGIVAPGFGAGAVGFIRVEAGQSLSFDANGRLAVDMQSAGSYDSVQNAGTVNVDGSLQIYAAHDFAPGTIIDVVNGGTITGQFDNVFSYGLNAPKRFGARYDVAGKVRATVLCGPADIAGQGADGNGDGILDNNDFIVFIDRFFLSDPRADYGSTGGVPGADGQFNNNDFVVFIDLFFAGCF